jgi:hypothetical protein
VIGDVDRVQARASTHKQCAQLIAVVLILEALSAPRAQEPSPNTPVGWLGLFNGVLTEWLENENQLQRLCAAFRDGSIEWYRCLLTWPGRCALDSTP